MDDWEEVNVDNLKLNDDLPSNNTESSIRNANANEGSVTTTSPQPTASESTPGLYVNMELGNAAGIPSTLLTALTTPKERFHALKIEDKIINFLKSNETATDISPGSNSFQRLLTYRIAQRMCLSHTTLSNDNSGNMNTIQLFKTQEAYVPKILLATVSRPPSTSPPPQEESNASVPNPNPVSVPTIMRPKLMLRNPNNKPLTNTEKSSINSNSSGSGPGSGPGPTLLKKPSQPDNVDQMGEPTDDVESRYAAAKARIFGNTEDAPDDNNNTKTSDITASTLPNPPKKNNKAEQNAKSKTITKPAIPDVQINNKKENTVLSGYKKDKQVVNVSQDWDLKNNSNSTLRNKKQEKLDPDFTRNQRVNIPGNVGVNTPMAYNSNPNPNSNPNVSYNYDQQYSQQQYPPPQGQGLGRGQGYYPQNITHASYNASGYQPGYVNQNQQGYLSQGYGHGYNNGTQTRNQTQYPPYPPLNSNNHNPSYPQQSYDPYQYQLDNNNNNSNGYDGGYNGYDYNHMHGEDFPSLGGSNKNNNGVSGQKRNGNHNTGNNNH